MGVAAGISNLVVPLFGEFYSVREIVPNELSG